MSPWITIVVAAYQRYLHLPILIHSFLTQTNQNWKMVILHDGPDSDHHKIVEPFIKTYSNITYHQSSERFNDWGYSLREWAMNEFVDTPWILNTNDDNYYVPIFLQECCSYIDKDPSLDFIMYDCLMNTLTENSKNQSFYETQYSFPKLGYIDIGSFIVKSDLIKDIGLNTKTAISDGLLVEDIINKHPNLNLHKLNKTLFVHN